MMNNMKCILGVHFITFYLLPTNPLRGWAVKIPITSKFTFDYYKHINKIVLVSMFTILSRRSDFVVLYDTDLVPKFHIT